MRKLGFVIINYNDYKTTINLINNIKDYKCLDLVLIVDNKSTDDSVKQLKKLVNKKIKLVEATENKGYAAGLNIGYQEIYNQLGNCDVIFSNSDIIIDSERDLIKLQKNLKKKIVVAAPVIDEHGILNRGWKLPSILDEILLNVAVLNKFIYKKNKYKNYSENVTYVDVVSGCFFMTKTEALDKIKGFDENTFLYYEENIFSKKLLNNDYKLVINNKVKIKHEHSITIDKNIKKVNKYKILKESQKYYVKNYLKANKFNLALLFLTNKTHLMIMKLRFFLTNIINKN